MLYIHGIGHYHPPHIIDNAFLEGLGIETSERWILERTGIRTRHTVLPLEYISETRNQNSRLSDSSGFLSNPDTASRAAAMALDRARLNISDIGLVIAGGSAPRFGAPAEACAIAARLGISVPAFDLNSACSTFAVQMRVLMQFQPDLLPDYVLLVNPENLTRAVDYSDRSTAVLIGDCTSAAIVSARVPGPARVITSFQHTDPAGWEKVVIPSAGYLRQDGPSVQSFAVRRTEWAIRHLGAQAHNGFFFIGHQANLLMVESAAARTGIAAERHLFNVDRRGNCGAAGAPSVLSENWDCFREGDEVVLAVVGAGLTWAGLLISFDGEFR
jgi:3-oxoacyl-[acyl-carrier-protein] synthase-3